MNSPEFESALREVIRRDGVKQIYSANPVAWQVLRGLLPDLAPEVELLGEAPAVEMLSDYNTSKLVSERLLTDYKLFSLGALHQEPIPKESFVALVHHAERIPGMCDHQKLIALCEVLRMAPKGDIVEIGSWWGKSAFILAFISSHYTVGNLLCVDPWSDAHLAQGDNLVDDLSSALSAAEAHRVFVANLIPYSHGNINYLRMPSVEGAARYRQSQKVSSEQFGDVSYAGEIALLHIDGNHEQSAVEADLAAWGSLMKPGGWIVFDDYRWPYGTGPRVVADRFVQENAAQIERAFYMGGAFFVQISG